MASGSSRVRVAAAATVGSVIEWYDFYVYGTSVVLVLAPLYFPSEDRLISSLLAFSTFGVGFLARPLGAVVLSHVGDRVGRKQALVASLLLMGAATFCVGLLPTYDQIGVAAPVLLVALRLVQGFAVGGEWGGAVVLVVEHAPTGRRALWGTFPQYGTSAGLLTSTLAILAASRLSGDAFMTWGWRVPFLASAVLVLVGLWTRRSIDDSTEFASLRTSGRVPRRPFSRLFSAHRRALIVGTLACLVSHAAYIVSAFLPGYATSALGIDTDYALRSLVVASTASFAVLFVAGLWLRTHEPRPLACAGAVLTGAWAVPAFALTAAFGGPGLLVGVAVGVCLLMLHYAALPALLADQFPAEVRYTGVSVCFQLSAVLAGGLLPLLGARLVAEAGGAYLSAPLLVVAAGVLSVAGIVLCARPPLATPGVAAPPVPQAVPES